MLNSDCPNASHSILTQPVDQLPVIEELVIFMHQHGFANLKELVAYQVSELLTMKGFGYRCLRSLYRVLEANGCEELLRQE